MTCSRRVLIRRVLLDPEQVSADPRSRRRRTLHLDQRALPLPELAGAGAIYADSFILTNLDLSALDKAIAAEHWYRRRTTVENLFRESKLGATLRHLPFGYPRSTWPRCGELCSPPAWPPGCTGSPLSSRARTSWPRTPPADLDPARRRAGRAEGPGTPQGYGGVTGPGGAGPVTGGPTSKIHRLADWRCRPLARVTSAGQRSTIPWPSCR